MSKKDAENLISQAKSGMSLGKEKRRRAIKSLLRSEDRSESELADLFNVSPRTIRRDKKSIRQKFSEELLDDYGLAGALFLEYRRSIQQLNNFLDEAEELKDKRLLVNDKWKISRDFFDRAKDLELEKRIENLEEKFE